MPENRCQTKPRDPSTAHLTLTAAALLLLAGSMLLALLLADREDVWIITLAAVLLGWIVTLTLVNHSPESPTPITNADDDSSSSSPVSYGQVGQTGLRGRGSRVQRRHP